MSKITAWIKVLFLLRTPSPVISGGDGVVEGEVERECGRGMVNRSPGTDAGRRPFAFHVPAGGVGCDQGGLPGVAMPGWKGRRASGVDGDQGRVWEGRLRPG